MLFFYHIPRGNWQPKLIHLLRLSSLGAGLLFLMCHCSHKEVQPQNAQATDQQEKATVQLDKAIKAMGQENYHQSIEILKKILVQNPASEFDFIVLYNLGSSYEGIKDCAAATQQYRHLVQGALKKYPRLEAFSLLRLSYTYECLGQNNKSLTVLLDLRRQIAMLPEDTQKSELPARLASAYLRMGNREEAQKYFKEALEGIKFLQIKYKDSKKLADTLASTLYFMGKSNSSEHEFFKNPLAQFQSLSLMQLYLLQAVEIQSPQWSKKALDEILNPYHKVWAALQKLAPSSETDEALKARAQKAQQQSLLQEALRSARLLRQQRLPHRKENPQVAYLFSEMEKEENKIVQALSSLDPDTDWTPQERTRQSLRKSGRVVSPQDSPLEKAAKSTPFPTQKQNTKSLKTME